jgi:hypothetical protein
MRSCGDLFTIYIMECIYYLLILSWNIFATSQHSGFRRRATS